MSYSQVLGCTAGQNRYDAIARLVTIYKIGIDTQHCFQFEILGEIILNMDLNTVNLEIFV